MVTALRLALVLLPLPLLGLDIGTAIRTPDDNSAATIAEARTFYATWGEGFSKGGGNVIAVNDDRDHTVSATTFVLNGPLDNQSTPQPTSGTWIIALSEPLYDGDAYHLEWPADILSATSGNLAASTDSSWNFVVSGSTGGLGGPQPEVIATPNAIAGTAVAINHTVLLFVDPDLSGTTAERTAGMVLTIHTLPAKGNLLLDESAISAGREVLVADVAAGKLKYLTSETTPGEDHFAFSWRDASGLETPVLWFEVGLSGGGGGAPSLSQSDFDVPITEPLLPLYHSPTPAIPWTDIYLPGVGDPSFDVTHSGELGEVEVTVAYDDADRAFSAWDQLRYVGSTTVTTPDATLDGVDGKGLQLVMAEKLQAGDLENLLEGIEYRHTSALFTVDSVRDLTVTIEEKGSDGGTITSTHRIAITATAAAPVLREIRDGSRTFGSGATFTIDQAGLDLSVVAYDYEQQTITVGIDPNGTIATKGVFSLGGSTTSVLASSGTIPGPHSLSTIGIRYAPTVTNGSDILDLQLNDGTATTDLSLTAVVNPLSGSLRPQLVADYDLLSIAAGGNHAHRLQLIQLAGISDYRLQGDPPASLGVAMDTGAGTIDLSWTASGRATDPVHFDLILLGQDSSGAAAAATIPVTTLAIDPAVSGKPTLIDN